METTSARARSRSLLCETATLGDAHEAIACLQRLAEVFGKRREQLAREVGLTDQQWGVLEEISREHFMPSLFAARQERSRSDVSKLIRQLSDRSLISVLVSKSDGRQRKYALTSKGKRAMDELRQRREQAIADVWLQLERGQVQSFTAAGSEIATRLEQYLSQAQPVQDVGKQRGKRK